MIIFEESLAEKILCLGPNLPNRVGALTNRSQFSRLYFEKQL